MHDIVFLDRDSVVAAVGRPGFPHRWQDYPQTRPEEVLPRLAGASIAVVNKVELRAATLAQLPQLKLIAISATGSNNVDLDFCRQQGIAVCTVRGYAATTVPEHTLMLILSLRRQLLAYRSDIAAGRWQTAPGFCFFDHPIRDLAGSTLVIVGSGSLGQGVARLAEAFGMTVLRAEHKDATTLRPGYVPFAEALQRADVLSLHCPLTDATRHLLGEAELAALPPGCILINTARGGLVDETALAAALRSGRIAAGFDVLSQEPPKNGNPLLAPDLLARPNFILTPHVAWASGGAMQAMMDQVISNIEAWAAGRARNLLT